jgi:hypothetical protein
MEGGKPKNFSKGGLTPKRPAGDSGAESFLNSSNYSSPMDEFGVSVTTTDPPAASCKGYPFNCSERVACTAFSYDKKERVP